MEAHEINAYFHELQETMCNLAPIVGANFPWDVILKNLEEHVPVEIKIQLTSMCHKLHSALETNEYVSS